LPLACVVAARISVANALPAMQTTLTHVSYRLSNKSKIASAAPAKTNPVLASASFLWI